MENEIGLNEMNQFHFTSSGLIQNDLNNCMFLIERNFQRQKLKNKYIQSEHYKCQREFADDSKMDLHEMFFKQTVALI